ncbi:non-specific lipid-transfer protein [Salix suchowensis]|nr:non-specific lipid-transfer protein [Salix suchowensis]
MNHTTINIFPPVLTSKLLAAAAPSPGSPSWCSEELVAFSPSTDTATSRCCDALSKAFNSGDGNLIALPSVCALSSSVSCSPALPHSVCTKLPPESVDGSPKSPVSPLAPGSHSSEEKHNSNNWFLPVVLTFIVILNTCNAAIVIYLPFDWHLKLFNYKFITAIAGVYRQI